MPIIDKLMEKFAEAQHEIWSHWMRYQMESGGHFTSHNDGPRRWLMQAGKVERWTRQMETPYAELTEEEKESDRKVVREFLKPILEDMLQTIQKIELWVEAESDHGDLYFKGYEKAKREIRFFLEQKREKNA